MMKFSDCITIKIFSKQQSTQYQQLENVEKLCQHLLWGILELKNEYLSSRFSLQFGDNRYLIHPFIRQDYWSRVKVKELHEIGMKHYFSFLDNAEGIDTITFNDIYLCNYDVIPDYSNSAVNKYDKTTKCNSIVFQVRSQITNLKFIECTLLGTANFPQVFPQIQRLSFENCILLNKGEYGQFKNLKELRVMSSETY
ncbi:hypothetical protein FGO68_gene12129 [Halteria grandinella]|uniref:Uncharacterized protein n=1 Tax=Halteria grandinella TaxID=5974 RepID=A0A8J8P3W5_HALGN|nr:hypothetical protein FGO68_gene12129 [Halteria grandinella]